MQGPVKKVLLLILLWSGFGFALSEYLEQTPSNRPSKDQPLTNNPIPQTDTDQPSDLNNSEQIQEQALEISDNIERTPIDEREEASERPQYSDNNVTDQTQASIGIGANTISIVRDTPELLWQEGWRSFSERLIQSAKANPDLKITVTGYFDPNEPIAEPNLGVQRSVRVKNELVTRGVNPDQINCRGTLNRLFDQSEPQQAIVIKTSRPLESIVLPDTPTSESRPTAKIRPQSERKTNIPKYKTIEYQPTFSDQGIIFDGALNQILPGAQQWLNLNPQNYIEILGHTDHVGHDQDNYRIALKWARQVRRFMISQGFEANRLKATSAGEQQPLYTNSNSRGRLKNRRIELILKF